MGLGVASDGAPLLSLFRKGASALPPKRVHVHGLIDNPKMNDGYHVKVGASSFDVHRKKGGGEYEGDVEGRGSLRVSYLEGVTPISEVAPSSVELSFEREPTVDVRFSVIWDNSRAIQ